MANLIKRLFKGNNKGCCNVKIEEVKTEGAYNDLPSTNRTNKSSSSCCKSGADMKRD